MARPLRYPCPFVLEGEMGHFLADALSRLPVRAHDNVTAIANGSCRLRPLQPDGPLQSACPGLEEERLGREVSKKTLASEADKLKG
jgi:hypothetical protein